MSGDAFTFELGIDMECFGETVWAIYRGERRYLARCSRRTGAVVGSYETGMFHGRMQGMRINIEQDQQDQYGFESIKQFAVSSRLEIVIEGSKVTLVKRGRRFEFDALYERGVLTARDWMAKEEITRLAAELMSAWTPPRVRQLRAPRATLEAAGQLARG